MTVIKRTPFDPGTRATLGSRTLRSRGRVQGGGGERSSLPNVKRTLHGAVTRSRVSFLVYHNFVPLHRHDSDVILKE